MCEKCDFVGMSKSKKIIQQANNMNNNNIFAMIQPYKREQPEMTVTLPDDNLKFVDNIYFHINYCPICGRKLV